jgi:hypothetical protein
LLLEYLGFIHILTIISGFFYNWFLTLHWQQLLPEYLGFLHIFRIFVQFVPDVALAAIVTGISRISTYFKFKPDFSTK